MKHNLTSNGSIARYQYVQEITSDEMENNPNLAIWVNTILEQQKWAADHNISFGQDIYKMICIYDNKSYDTILDIKGGVPEAATSGTPNKKSARAGRLSVLLWFNKNKQKSFYEKLMDKAIGFSL